MEQTLQSLPGYISTHGVFAIFMGMFLIGVGVPVPSEITLGFAGYLIYTNQLKFVPVIAASVLGEVLGSIISYGIGFYSATAIVSRYWKKASNTNRKMASVQQWLNRYGMTAVFLGRIFPVIRGAVPIPAGLLQMNFTKYVMCIMVSSIIWCIALVYLGIALGQNWLQIYAMAGNSGLVIAGLFVAVVAGAFIYRRSRKKI